MLLCFKDRKVLSNGVRQTVPHISRLTLHEKKYTLTVLQQGLSLAYNCACPLVFETKENSNKKTMLSQGELRDAAMNFDRPIKFNNSIVQFLCHSTAFLLVFVCSQE